MNSLFGVGNFGKFREILAKFGKTLLACADLSQLARVAGELPQRDRHGLGARLVEDRRLGFLISKSTTARREGDFVLAADFEFGAVKERTDLLATVLGPDLHSENTLGSGTGGAERHHVRPGIM